MFQVEYFRGQLFTSETNYNFDYSSRYEKEYLNKA